MAQLKITPQIETFLRQTLDQRIRETFDPYPLGAAIHRRRQQGEKWKSICADLDVSASTAYRQMRGYLEQQKIYKQCVAQKVSQKGFQLPIYIPPSTSPMPAPSAPSSSDRATR